MDIGIDDFNNSTPRKLEDFAAESAWRWREMNRAEARRTQSFNARPPRLEGATPLTNGCGRSFWKFQSAPPPLGGGDRRFNPFLIRRCVSIRAPPAWRGRQGHKACKQNNNAVSIRAPPAWRGRRGLMTHLGHFREVSIRAPPAWRGRRIRACGEGITLTAFQSAPPPLGGGDVAWSADKRRPCRFQSAPPPLGGGDS